VKFHVGDRVKLGSTRIGTTTDVGTITDVGTVLIQVKTSEGRLRVVCPWEVVRIPR
jgi:small-conductance mechanosensitive channel